MILNLLIISHFETRYRYFFKYFKKLINLFPRHFLLLLN
jgi:hypothetical protein